ALNAVEQLKSIVPPGVSLTQFALRWILMHDAVSCAIPGARRPDQVDDNVSAADVAPLSDEMMASIKRIYDESIRELVHHRW
ncbi:MAG: aldo/keto reductase, partial [Pirellula sp.]